MSKEMSEEELYQIARKRVEEKKGFYSHLSVYVIVNIILIVIWAGCWIGSSLTSFRPVLTLRARTGSSIPSSSPDQYSRRA